MLFRCEVDVRGLFGDRWDERLGNSGGCWKGGQEWLGEVDGNLICNFLLDTILVSPQLALVDAGYKIRE